MNNFGQIFQLMIQTPKVRNLLILLVVCIIVMIWSYEAENGWLSLCAFFFTVVVVIALSYNCQILTSKQKKEELYKQTQVLINSGVEVYIAGQLMVPNQNSANEYIAQPHKHKDISY